MTRQNARWTTGAVVVLLVLAGCAPQGDDPEARRGMLDAIRAEVGLAPGPPPACNVDDPLAFVRLATLGGDNCLNFEVQIGGYTQACVAARDDRARLNALRQVAAAECQRFCQSVNCKSSILVRQNDCASANAFRSDECPPGQKCPLLNYCTLLGATDVRNCICGP